MKLLKRLIICVIAVVVTCFVFTTAYAEEIRDPQIAGWKDFSVGSNEHTFFQNDNGIAISSVLEKGKSASEDNQVLGGYAYYLYEKDLKNNDTYTVEFTVESNWLEDASNYAYYTIAFTDEPTIWYLSHACVLMQIFPAGGNLSNGGAVRFIMRCVDDGVYFDVKLKVPFGAYNGSLSSNRVAIKFCWEETDDGETMAAYFNDARITELVDGTATVIDDTDSAVTSFMLGMSSLYVSASQEFHGYPREGTGVCKSVITEICGTRFDGETEKTDETKNSGCNSYIGTAIFSSPVVVVSFFALPLFLIKKAKKS